MTSNALISLSDNILANNRHHQLGQGVGSLFSVFAPGGLRAYRANSTRLGEAQFVEDVNR